MSIYPQSDAEAFKGTIECDEVYIGGKEKWKHKSMHNKIINKIFIKIY